MKLLLSDLPLNVNKELQYYDCSALTIQSCLGCFGCWTRTPGQCVLRDDANQITRDIARSEELIFVSKVRYGGYDSTLKKMLERAIPLQQAFIRIHNNETHHVQRDVKHKKAVILAYDCKDKEEQEIFLEVVKRNAHNMSFSSYEVKFINKEEIQSYVERGTL